MTQPPAASKIRIQKLQILVGREDEVQILRDAYQRVSDSQDCEAVLVFGESGSGKTALVRQTFHASNDKPLDDGTLFVSGKFDEIIAARPFSAIVDALTQLCRKTFAEATDDLTLGVLKERLFDRLGATDLEILCNLLPALATVFAVKEDRETEVETAHIVENVTFAFPRFAEIVRSFLYTVAGILDQPLIVFLDDVQWADPESLSLITSLTSLHSSCRNLLLILAYRDNDEYQIMNQSRLVSTTTGFHIKEIKLNGLDVQGTNLLVAKTLRMNPEDTLTLSDLIWQRTGGNIYFVVEFLHMLHREDLLHFSLKSYGWEWNIKKIKGETDVTDNVAALLTAKIQQLSRQVQSMLQVAACVGFYFEIEILERIFDAFNKPNESDQGLHGDASHEELEVDKELYRAAHVTTASFREMIDLTCHENLLDFVRDSIFKFSHDRVQQAAYQMIPAGNEKDLMHWRIGQIIWSEQRRRTSLISHDWLLFTAADQLNKGWLRNAGVINDEETRLAVVRLNLEAGKKAFEKSAFKYAAEFSTVACC
jgi:predicted ATPase